MKAVVGWSGGVGGIVGYALHGVRPGRNPLRRLSDLVEATAWLTAILLVLFIVPLGALHIGVRVYAAGVETEGAQAANRHLATAVLLEDVPTTMGTDDFRVPHRPTTARWEGTDGAIRYGVVDARPGKRSGARVEVWIDRTGRPTVAPQTHAHTLANGIAAGLGALVGASAGLVALAHAVRLGLDRHRLARWDIEWTLFETRWNRRRRPGEHQ